MASAFVRPRPDYGATSSALAKAYSATSSAFAKAYGATSSAFANAYGATSSASAKAYGATSSASAKAYGATSFGVSRVDGTAGTDGAYVTMSRMVTGIGLLNCKKTEADSRSRAMADSFSSAPSALGEGMVKPSKYRTIPDQESTTMPKGAPYIIGSEFAERFSFYGMRSILVVCPVLPRKDLYPR